ncbi:MAG: hypothetical protein DRP51_10280 [Candidatus Zixiibacteriota bacterium]|nr:MAG: hypothetical protein DRP51_10280 [candidate division Zixibacteria bacterium]
MIKSSTTYALTGKDNIILAKGTSKEMHRIRKFMDSVRRPQKVSDYRVWNAPSANIGDQLR